jgi:glycosyltransferase involved in cell wall biosynthesis
MVSVIIPLHNKEQYILNTIYSVLNQTFKAFEVLVVNDGSTDNSLQVLKTVNDIRLRVFSIENSGVSVARNLGLEKSNYEYVSFLDADDYWDNNFLSEIVMLVNQYPKERVFASGRTSLFKNHKIQYQNSFLPDLNEVDKIDYLKVISKFLPPVNSSNALFKKTALLEAGVFKEDQKQHEDHDLWLRVCRSSQVVYVNKPLSYYRKDIQNSGSKSSIRYFDFKEYLITILETKNFINRERNKYFKKYYNKFILLTFIKYQSGFSKDETKELIKLFQKIVSPFYFGLLHLINLLPSGMTYNLLSKLRG